MCGFSEMVTGVEHLGLCHSKCAFNHRMVLPTCLLTLARACMTVLQGGLSSRSVRAGAKMAFRKGPGNALSTDPAQDLVPAPRSGTVQVQATGYSMALRIHAMAEMHVYVMQHVVMHIGRP